MRFTVLDGWRGMAALMVALFHLQALGHFYQAALVRHAYLFVDFFFVLSGFVLLHAYRDRLSDGAQFVTFIVRRFGRIYPLHLALVLALVLLEAAHLLAQSAGGSLGLRAAFTESASPGAIISNALLTHALGLHDQLTLNHPSWSISAEFWTYLVFGLVCLAAAGRKKTLAAAAAVLAAAGALVVGRYSPEFIDTTYRYGFFRCLYGFFVGVLTCLAFEATPTMRPPPALATAGELLAIGATGLFVSLAGEGPWSLAGPLVFAAVVGVFACEAGAFSRLLNSRPIVWLGTLSYSIYLCHFLVLLFMRHGFTVLQKLTGQPMFAAPAEHAAEAVLISVGGKWTMDALALVYLMGVVSCAAVTYRCIESPGRRYFNRLAADWVPRQARAPFNRVAMRNEMTAPSLAPPASEPMSERLQPATPEA